MSKKLRDNFDVRIKQPIDKRFTQENNNVDTPYQGLLKFQPSDKKYYKYVDGQYIDFFKDIIDLINDNDSVSPEDFGAIGDGVTDDTNAVQLAFDSGKNVIFNHDYAVTHVETSHNELFYNFNGYKLIGIATNSQNSVLTLKTQYATYFHIKITAQMKDNYYCCLQILSTAIKQTQYNEIYGCYLKESIYGMVWGAKDGEASVMNAQSETYIYGFRSRSTMIPFLGNQSNGYLTFVGATFDGNVYEYTGTTSTRYNSANGICVKNIEGDVVIVGSEIVMADRSNGLGIYGKQIFINDTIIEVGGMQGTFTGNASLTNLINGYVGNGTLDFFTVVDGSTGTLTLRNFRLGHPVGSGTFVSNKLVSGNAPNYLVIVDNVKIDETIINSNLISGVMYQITNLLYTTANININATDLNNISSIDGNALDLPTTTLNTSQGNWYFDVDGGSSIQRIDFSSYTGTTKSGFKYTGGASWTEIHSRKIPIVANNWYCISGKLFTTGSGSGLFLVEWFTKDGVSISKTTLKALTSTIGQYNVFMKAPDTACYARLIFNTNGSNLIYGTDIKIHGMKGSHNLFMASAKPTTGAFEKGDIVYNSNPTASNPMGWVCTAAPSTFIALANIAVS